MNLLPAGSPHPTLYRKTSPLTESAIPPAIPSVFNFGDPTTTREARLWRGDGWTARVIKNEDDDGWAVAMIKDGEPEPALIGPWTMGRDKKNPKPLDGPAFSTLVKTACVAAPKHHGHSQISTLHSLARHRAR